MKSAVDQKDLKFGVVITWVISIVQKNIVATATCLEGVDLLTLAVERVYRVSLKIVTNLYNQRYRHTCTINLTVINYQSEQYAWNTNMSLESLG